MKKIILDNSQINEINNLIDLLEQQKELYKNFDNFLKLYNDALTVARALVDGDYNTFKKFSLHYTKHDAQKMRGIDSLSTYKKTSQICQYLSACGGVCAKCYAEKSLKLYKTTLTPQLIYNTLLLKYIDLNADQIPYINAKYFRFESFSDLQSAKHFKNLLAICKKNKSVIFTLWTKAGKKLYNFMQSEKIDKLPNNLNVVYSEFHLDNKTDENYIKELASLLNSKNALKVFCVFDDDKKRIDSNMFLCRGRCADCLKCYKKSNKVIYIAEKLRK